MQTFSNPSGKGRPKGPKKAVLRNALTTDFFQKKKGRSTRHAHETTNCGRTATKLPLAATVRRAKETRQPQPQLSYRLVGEQQNKKVTQQKINRELKTRADSSSRPDSSAKSFSALGQGVEHRHRLLATDLVASRGNRQNFANLATRKTISEKQNFSKRKKIAISRHRRSNQPTSQTLRPTQGLAGRAMGREVNSSHRPKKMGAVTRFGARTAARTTFMIR